MRNYYVYLLKDPNSLIPKYVGISNNPENRFKQHLQDQSFTKKVFWINSLKENNQIPILEIIHESKDIKEICKLEIEYIEKYKIQYELTNTTLGGEYYGIGTPIDVFNLQGVYLESFDSIVEYCETYNVNCESAISAVCLRKRNYTHNKIFRYSGDIVTEDDLIKLNKALEFYKPINSIYILNLEGDVLDSFSSIKDASSAGYGSEAQLRSCINHPEKYCSVYGNLICTDLNKYSELLQNYLTHINKIGKWINQYDLNGNFIKKYPSVNIIKKYLNVSSLTGLYECLKRNDSTLKFKNYLWRYSMSTENVEPYKKYNPGEKSKQRAKKVAQYTITGELIQIYDNVKDACEKLNLKERSLRDVLQGYKKSLFGFIWKYYVPCD